jgi:YrbI family 3-deoxy-D-manno-octulosonate 8-phosphate phosphatase
MSKLQTVVIDVDGVLTDGKVWYNSRGERSKAFHSRDIRAIRQLVSHGYRVILLTQSTWPGIDDYANRTGAEVVISREKAIDPAWGKYIAIGDDTPDLEVLRGATLAYCPMDADLSVKSEAKVYPLARNGGDGVIAELINVLEVIKVAV